MGTSRQKQKLKSGLTDGTRHAKPILHMPKRIKARRVSKGTARRSIRIEDGLWRAALAKAAEEGRDVSAVIRELLTKWIKGDDA